MTTSVVLSRLPWAVMALALPCSALLALPEDAQMPIQAEYDNSELLLDEGVQKLYGSSDSPAEITQGTLRITGEEIIIERSDGEVKKVTVMGSPARYQQQPAADQALAVAEGMTIILDYDNQHLSMDGEVSFTQGNDVWTGCHIDYYIESRRLTTPPSEDCRSSAIITPRNGQ